MSLAAPQTSTGRTSPGAQPPLEPFALASLLSAVILGLCPLGAMAAIILGSMGLRRLALAPGVRRGVGMAWLGIGLGLAIPLVEIFALERLQAYVSTQLNQTSIAAIRTTLAGTPPTGTWVPPTAGGATPEELTAFAAGLNARLGELRDVRLTNRTQEGFLQLVVSAAFTAEFERGVAFGSAEFVPAQGSDPTQLRMRSMLIDIGGTRIQIPSKPEPTPAAP